MRRFFGMMPEDEVEKRGVYADSEGHHITIQAGPNGWTVIYSRWQSSDYADKNDTTDNNYQKAYNRAVDVCGELTAVELNGQLVKPNGEV